MAQEKARRPRAQKEADGTAAKEKATAVVRAPPAQAGGDRRRHAGRGVATYAYHLWECGEPGDVMEHWLRAERELAA